MLLFRSKQQTTTTMTMDSQTENGAIFSSATKLFSYSEYKEHIRALFEEGKSTGAVQDEMHLEATALNLHRINRLDKSRLDTAFLEETAAFNRPVTWYLISEGWCGDSAQNLPWIAKMADAGNAKLRILLRDDNPEIMDQYLTNGSRSVPKLMMVDDESGRELAQWGPRPEAIQEKVLEFKKEKPDVSHKELVEKIQLWYGRDRGHSIQKEFSALMKHLTKAG